jgi:hypothetical protein
MKQSPWGIDSMDAEDEATSKKNQEFQTELNRQFAICFSTPTGRKVLEYLKGVTIEQPTWYPNGHNGATAVQMGFMREGQNSITNDIIQRITNSTKKK